MGDFRACSRSHHRTRSRWKNRFYSFAHRSGLTSLARTRFAGCGAILLTHEIHGDLAGQLMTGVSPAFLDAALRWLASNGWKFVSLGDAMAQVANREQTRFICLTFDDGYRDNLIHALPILERHAAPFALYVPTGAITRNLDSWWLGLRRLFMTRDVVDIEPMDARFRCRDLDSKRAGLAAVDHWVHHDYRRSSMLEPTFRGSGISLQELNEEYFLSRNELETLSRHPLVTVGAHTTSHAALSTLDEVSARREMSENRDYLENLLQKPVRHFAYPYGDARACGPREGAMAAEMGFETAVTGRQGQVRREHADYPHVLPRIGINAETTLPTLDVRVSGFKQAPKGQSQIVTW